MASMFEDRFKKKRSINDENRQTSQINRQYLLRHLFNFENKKISKYFLDIVRFRTFTNIGCFLLC